MSRTQWGWFVLHSTACAAVLAACGGSPGDSNNKQFVDAAKTAAGPSQASGGSPFGRSLESVPSGMSTTGAVTGPSGAVLINNGAVATSSTRVTISAATQVGSATQVCLSNSSTCSAWSTYSPVVSWNLTSGDGKKVVRVWWKDKAGNVSATAATGTIVLDSTPPSGGGLTASLSGRTVTWSWTGFVNTGSGIATYNLVTSTTATPAGCTSGTKAYSGTATSFTQNTLAPGVYYALLCATDAVGNSSAGVSGKVTVPDCSAGAKQCSGNTLQVCSAIGKWQTSQTCPYVCSAGSCTGVCVPGSKSCSGNVPQTCSSSGQWQSSSACQYACSAGSCTGVCVPGSQVCSGNVPQTCSSVGQWQAGATCAYECVSGTCSDACTPGTPATYNGIAAQACADNGHWTQTSCAYGCSQGQCLSCPPGQNSCSGQCANLQLDANNCGACGNACASGASCFYGRCSATLRLFGQSRVTEATRDTPNAHSMYHAPGVVVDRSHKPNRVYVADSGNNRILAYRALGRCAANSKTMCTNDTDCSASDTCVVRQES